MAVTLDIQAVQSDNGKKITVNDTSENRSENITDLTSVSFSIARWNYETDAYETIGSVTLNESYTSQDQMEYYIEIYDGDMVISSKQNSTKQTIGSYSNDIIKDGIWRIEYSTSHEESAQVFLFHYNYERKLGVYTLFRDLPSHFKQDQIRYNRNVESALLRKAILNSLNFSAEFGQLEIIEEIDLLLKDLLNND